ncbi:MAG: hypothetical protein U0271_29485 [Polyangiaceae bacterium]
MTARLPRALPLGALTALVLMLIASSWAGCASQTICDYVLCDFSSGGAAEGGAGGSAGGGAPPVGGAGGSPLGGGGSN